jgi:hypothetical protein
MSRFFLFPLFIILCTSTVCFAQSKQLKNIIAKHEALQARSHSDTHSETKDTQDTVDTQGQQARNYRERARMDEALLVDHSKPQKEKVKEQSFTDQQKRRINK